MGDSPNVYTGAMIRRLNDDDSKWKELADYDRDIKALEDEARAPREGDEHYFDVFDGLVRQVIMPTIEHSGGDFESLYDGSGTESGDERDFLAAAIGQCVGFLDDRLGEKSVKIAEQAATIIRQRASIDLLDTLPDAHLIEKQAKTIIRLQGLLRRERYEVLHDRGCDCDLCVAVDAALKESS